MAEIPGPRIESITDLGPGSQDQPYQRPSAKPAVAALPAKPAPPSTPEIGAPDEEEKPKLDEMA
jgi:hypothetical protein